MARAVDKNQPAIVAALREAGATVEQLHAVGHGCPDIVVGFRGVNYLMEIKNPRGRMKLTTSQRAWHRIWRGQVIVVSTVADALHIIEVKREEIHRSLARGLNTCTLEEDLSPGGNGCGGGRQDSAEMGG